MRRDPEKNDETSTIRETLFLVCSGGSLLSALASLICFYMSRNMDSEGINVGVLLAILMSGCGIVLGLLGLLCAYSLGTMAFGLASLVMNGVMLRLIEMR